MIEINCLADMLQQSQQVWGDNPYHLLNTGKVTSGVLGPDKGLQGQKRHGHTEDSPKKGHKDDEETGASVL